MRTREQGPTKLRELLVVVPHAGLLIPPELPADTLAADFPALLPNLDWYTDALYDFRDLLESPQERFAMCSLLLEANRDPQVLDEAVPLQDVLGRPLYRAGQEPNPAFRRLLAQKYLVPFHKRIEAAIGAGAELLLDGHSTVPARGVAANQIDLMSFQHTARDDEVRHYCPPVLVETYAEELRRRLPDVLVTVNASEYWNVHGHVCAEHSVNALGRVGKRAPAILQETCQPLYCRSDGTVDLLALDRLRRAFAEALAVTYSKVRAMRRAEKVLEIHNLRQTFDFDCGAKALQTLFAYYGVDLREDALLRELEVDETHGTDVQKMIRLAERLGFRVESGTGWTLEQVKQHVLAERPVIVLLQAWVNRFMTLRDWRHSWDDGHYAVVMGYNEEVLFFQDPASLHTTWLREAEFLARWHDRDPHTGEKLHNFGLVLHGREPAGQTLAPMG
ncbi:MAG: N-formylglutamate amidohydrolase [Myxococcota bacterium]|jgi:predicted double-glycine peptidase|nr:N-formylglutamate amidohydrolase [Myxococcota bacterium]